MEPNLPQINEKEDAPNDGPVDEKRIASRIFVVRGQQVMLDTDIAELYKVDMKRLNQQMSRNKTRFPMDFCFQLNESEQEVLKLQSG